MKGNGNLTGEVADRLIELIIENDLHPGDRLPNEFALAEQLGVGRSTIREAVRRLVSRNILEVRQGAGTFVSDKYGVPEDPLGLTFMGNDPKLARDLQDIRMMLEPEICAALAQRITKKQLEQLKKLNDECTRLIESGQDYSEADARFHRYLAECSGNQVLRNLIPIITSSVLVVIVATGDENRQLTVMEHQRIVDAIFRRDAVGARNCMLAHLNTSRETMMKMES